MKEALIEPVDDRCQETVWKRNYHVILSSFTTNRKSIKPAEINIYTDGSKTDNGTGAGFVVYHKNIRTHIESISLPDSTTFFQAEITAIFKAMIYMVGYCKSHSVSYLKILCDSQAAILALNSNNVKSKTVLKTIRALNDCLLYTSPSPRD